MCNVCCIAERPTAPQFSSGLQRHLFRTWRTVHMTAGGESPLVANGENILSFSFAFISISDATYFSPHSDRVDCGRAYA